MRKIIANGNILGNEYFVAILTHSNGTESLIFFAKRQSIN